jgi:hypothetical protein
MASLLVLPLQTQLPWYSLLLWPPFCLALGPVLVGLVRRDGALALPGAAGLRAVPRLWCGLGVLVLLAAAVGGVGLLPALRPAALVALPAGLGLLLGGTWLAARRPRQRLGGLITLALGFWLSLVLLFGSPLWLWELNERWPVKPVALQVQTQVQDQALAGADLHLWRQGERPSLNWYLARRVPLADGPGDLQGDGQGVSWLLSEQRPQPAGWDCQLPAGVGDGAGEQPGPGPQAQPGLQPGQWNSAQPSWLLMIVPPRWPVQSINAVSRLPTSIHLKPASPLLINTAMAWGCCALPRRLQPTVLKWSK